MKKFLLSMMAICGMSTLTFAQATGTQENPLSVDEFIEMGVPSPAVPDTWVEGYIIGFINNNAASTEAGLTFSASGAVASNIIIASSTSETDLAYIVPVQLAAGTDIRAALNLLDHPENLHHQVKLCGSHEGYFKNSAQEWCNGLKSLTSYEWVGEAPVATPVVANTGSYENPLTVADFLAEGKPSKAVPNTFLKGVIVGYVPGMTLSEGVFSAEGTVSKTNILLAESADVTSTSQCVPVQLQTGTEIQALLNLLDNPGNLGKTVILQGSHEAYFGAAGLKTPIFAEIDGKTAGSMVDPSVTTDAIYNGLVSDANDWTLEQGTLPEGATYVWAWDSTYGLKGSAFINGGFAADAWAISPVIDLAGATDCTLSLSQAFNFAADGYNTYAKTFVREENGEWNALTIDPVPAGNSWSFIDGKASLADYDGKKIQIGFNYISTESVCPTWEIKNVVVTGVSGVAEIEAEAAPAVYGLNGCIVAPEGAKVFNLQGVQTGTENLAAGIYVVVVGRQAVKVVVK